MRPRRANDTKKRKGDDDAFDIKIINIRRVARMYKGGRRMRLSVFVAIGDKKGQVAVGIGKGADVKSAQEKAVSHAKRHLIKVALRGKTLPHEVEYKYGAALVLMKPASPGTGVVAGSSMRVIAELAGVEDMLGKIKGSSNTISNAYASLYALQTLRSKRL